MIILLYLPFQYRISPWHFWSSLSHTVLCYGNILCWWEVFHFIVLRTIPTTINQGWVKRKNRGAEILLSPFNHFVEVKSTVFFASVNFSLTYLFIFPRLLKASERYKKALEQVFIIILCGTKYIYIIITWTGVP